MSTPLVALALAAMCALFSAAAADTAQAIGLRNHAANEARRVATVTLDSCAVGNATSQRCTLPPGCAAPACGVCRHGDAVRADVSLDWSPVILRGLAPAHGRHALDLNKLNVGHLAGTSLAVCTSPSSTP
ncbi:hypothetical protein [Candidatus Poriferisodalis sp.]|uniref:hypothetical protein n=1 Tax=Candidatus Poriferisodalis sp. TaxID=3101277 RepID=UPI003B01716E